MVKIEPITARNAIIFRAIRLRALLDAPRAFGSTYAKEIEFNDAEWERRVANWNGTRGIGFLAMDGAHACGLCGAFLDPDNASQTQLVSMWTAPDYRKQGVGTQLIEAVFEWARRRRATTMKLMVTTNNDPALMFYNRLGFHLTGRTEPYPNDPALLEYEMQLQLLS